jgi:hypothetical protein
VVTGSPLAYRKPVTSSVECRLVVRGHFDILLAVGNGGERFSAELDIMGRGLAAVLHEWITRLGFCENFLFVMWEIEIVYREDQSGQVVWRGRKGLGESGDLPCLSGRTWKEHEETPGLFLVQEEAVRASG